MTINNDAVLKDLYPKQFSHKDSVAISNASADSYRGTRIFISELDVQYQAELQNILEGQDRTVSGLVGPRKK